VGRTLVIGVQWPKGNDCKHCVHGPEVEQGVIAPSLPPASAMFELKAGTSIEDAERIADCIRSHLGPGSDRPRSTRSNGHALIRVPTTRAHLAAECAATQR
jgi:hypothetical protein